MKCVLPGAFTGVSFAFHSRYATFQVLVHTFGGVAMNSSMPWEHPFKTIAK